MLETIIEIFNLPSDADLSTIVLDEFPGWDSFNIIQLLETFENNYGIALTLEELREFTTMKDVYQWADRKIKN